MLELDSMPILMLEAARTEGAVYLNIGEVTKKYKFALLILVFFSDHRIKNRS